MAATTTMSMEATTTSIFSHLHTSLPTPFLSPLSKLSLKSHQSSSFSSSLHLRISLKNPLFPCFKLRCSVEEVALLEDPIEIEDGNQKRKLYVENLAWSLSADDVKKAFSECGTVKDVELIKHKNGKNRGYAFVTMASGDEAQAVVDKFNDKELSGRTIRVEYSKKLRKPRPQPPVDVPARETRHKLYISNLQWKVRSNNLREFFSADFNPVSARVVFENPSGRSAGYGFVSFNTREEAEAAISSLNGKELLGRPISLKFSERNVEDKAGDKEEEKEISNESVSSLGEE